MFRVFGLTGGIGSGKSSVAKRFRDRGLPVVDSDALAREVVAPGSAGLAEITRTFGPDVVKASGELDRATLAARVFGDPEARARLEAITHPRIRALADRLFARERARGEPLVCNEVPLLVEVGLAEVLRPLVVVAASDATRIARVHARDGLGEAQIRARMAAQRPLAEKIALADYVIDNDGPPAATLERADAVLEAICDELGVDRARYPR